MLRPYPEDPIAPELREVIARSLAAGEEYMVGEDLQPRPGGVRGPHPPEPLRLGLSARPDLSEGWDVRAAAAVAAAALRLPDVPEKVPRGGPAVFSVLALVLRRGEPARALSGVPAIQPWAQTSRVVSAAALAEVRLGVPAPVPDDPVRADGIAAAREAALLSFLERICACEVGG